MIRLQKRIIFIVVLVFVVAVISMAMAVVNFTITFSHDGMIVKTYMDVFFQNQKDAKREAGDEFSHRENFAQRGRLKFFNAIW